MDIKNEKWRRKRKWEFVANRTYLPFSISLMSFDSCKRSLDKIFPVKIGDYHCCYQDDNYLAKGSRKILAREQIKAYKKQGSSFLWKIPKMCERRGNKIIKIMNDFSLVNFSKLNTREIKNHLKYFSVLLRDFSGFIQYPLSLESFFERKIDKIVKNYSSQGDIQKLKKDLVEPIKFNEGQYEQLAFLKIAKKVTAQTAGYINPNKSISDRIKKDLISHLKKFSWLQLRWLSGKLMIPEDLINRSRYLPSDLSKQINFWENKAKKVKEITGIFIKLNQLSKEDAEIIWLAKEYIFLRTFRSDTINHALFYAIPLLKEIAYRLNLSYNDVLYMSPEEISTCLDKGLIVGDIKISQRKNQWALLREGNEVYLLQGEQAEKFADIQGLKKEYPRNLKELKGHIAFSGKVKGTVKVVITTDDLRKVLRGDILIAVMTFPSYITAMVKASAFVTDEGGMLCHAAIIAREMNKPCIIGTKIATKVLHDGDFVEVDADRGIVKIIKKVV